MPRHRLDSLGARLVTAPTRLRAVIVDDEPLARDALRAGLSEMAGVDVVGEAADGPAAVRLIRERAPDVAFLDVRMPGLDGFGVLDALEPDERPDVVFVTAFDDHAVRAFEVHALDYLVKPFDDQRLEEAVGRIRERRRQRHAGQLADRLEDLLRGGRPSGAGEPGPPAGGWHTRIQVREDDRIRFVDVADLRYVETDGNHLLLHLGDETVRIRHTLKDLLAVLDPRRFVRVHRSTALNVDYLDEVQPWFSGDYVAILKGGEELRVSRHYRDHLLRSSF